MRSPFAHKPFASSSSVMAQRVGVSTVHSPMLGLNEVYKLNNINNEVKKINSTVKAHIPHSRSARRIAKYQLHDDENDNNNNYEDVNENENDMTFHVMNTAQDNKRLRAAVNVSEFMEHNHVNEE